MSLLLFWRAALAQNAYVGVADVGGGRGVLGHVFLVLTDARDEVAEGIAYQFAIDVPPEYRVGPRSLTDLTRYPFTLARTRAADLIASYTEEDRAVVLHHLRLGPAQIRAVAAAVDAEVDERLARPRRDFRLDHNCATATFDLINSGLGRRAFNHASPFGVLVDARADARGWLSIPVTALPRLARHPLVDRRRVFEPVTATRLRTTLAAWADLAPLFERCGVSANARDLLARAFANPALGRSAEYSAAFARLLGPCARRAGLTAVFNDHLDVLIYLAGEDFEQRARIEAMYL